MITVVYHAGMNHQGEWAARMRDGLNRHGVRHMMKRTGEPVDTPAAICWGWRIGQKLREKGREVLVAERGYLGDRFHWTSLGWNGLNGRADFRNAGMDGERWRLNFAGLMRDWTGRDGPTVIMGQVPTDTALAGIDYQAWLNDTAAALPDALFRPHPGALNVRCGLPLAEGDLDAVLTVAGRVVVYNSNSATDAVLAGVPAITIDRGAVTWSVTGHELHQTFTPDRTQWAHDIAWAQWSPDEISRGDAWEHIGKGALEC
ncbi:MAG: hypothetical protein ACMVO3_22720 [Thalassobaculum sp.]